ncbi:MAG: undecaprenyldiphospho-muramoylpentapeptide beta-N-acetylglucosaminyltransferase [Sphingobacteriales bacterium]|jgi:UDP-N-acetylglucosamine--N-acetylmuramyl-(pentapeptide) pyrophosphoryl-undecaprenol N-acetylglucosamine transferase|nr:undecaprenyldiphospho-muramoylpentapeptide beta-N-acetylglucosaminyltransferase [Sphingobacteriales bacterium]MBP9140758.1 undecaprenyldiphospho-muramoylpentapeptide beta-N-acetylglucosaminyltransferase [Chitinophagales bacterium]MDA0197878.1 undecaprenyldiphospho-muramoylpentapeptide beta-N-acetylglucosaminyltransferase [Bacteroidota bacterium]MBK7527760.1 undecaprenyldiphospho-muramoylpentapeptide beta-N-acetylglucosaminyltransferase [Sphingobacteriales bacterium]MBL0246514.1 undecaprenyld
MSLQPKIIISGGGTGGHVFPAIAIANAIKTAMPKAQLLFVGAKGKIEMQKVPQAGYQIEGLWISGLQRKLTFNNLSFPFKVVSSLWKSWGIIQRFKPQVAVGVGGYASGPLLQAAALKKIPIVLQEQNSYPGITNKLLAKHAAKICVVYDGMEQWFPEEKIIRTGNPVRSQIVELSGNKLDALSHFNLHPDKKTLFVTGGSLGARGINNGILQALPHLFNHHNNINQAPIQIIWQCGQLYINELKPLIEQYKESIYLTDFIDRMDLAYIAADGIVSRAGGTISELCLVGKPTILMPSPNVAEDHQTANAQQLMSKNAALMVTDKEADTQLYPAITKILFDAQFANLLAENIKRLAIPDAANRIAEVVLNQIIYPEK